MNPIDINRCVVLHDDNEDIDRSEVDQFFVFAGEDYPESPDDSYEKFIPSRE